jgi:hypothetical protein
VDKIITSTVPVAYVASTVSVHPDPRANRRFWLDRRQALLNEVDGIERALEISPRTSEIRRQYRAENS